MINTEFYQKKMIIDELLRADLINSDEWYSTLETLIEDLEINIEK